MDSQGIAENNAEKPKSTNSNPIIGNTPFTSEYQPSPEKKKEGWDRRKQAQAFMDLVMKYQEMKYEKFIALGDGIETKPANYTMREVLAYRYVAQGKENDRYLIDWLDRHVSKAPQDINIDKPANLDNVTDDIKKIATDLQTLIKDEQTATSKGSSEEPS